MTYSWIKLHLDILDDSKVEELPLLVFKRYIEFLLVAREQDQDGLLGNVHHLAWRLRTSEKDVLKALHTLSEAGITAETAEGWLVVNFAKRQAAMGGAERIRQARARKHNSPKDGSTGHAEVKLVTSFSKQPL
jgi:hypothetical protein